MEPSPSLCPSPSWREPSVKNSSSLRNPSKRKRFISNRSCYFLSAQLHFLLSVSFVQNSLPASESFSSSQSVFFLKHFYYLRVLDSGVLSLLAFHILLQRNIKKNKWLKVGKLFNNTQYKTNLFCLLLFVFTRLISDLLLGVSKH